MDIKKSLPLIAAGTLGVVAFIAARQLSSPAPMADPSQKVKWVELPSAARDIEPGQIVSEKDILAIKVDERAMGGSVVPDSRMLVGRVTSTMIGKGSLFSSQMLAAEGSGSGLAGILKPGQRAMTLEINEFNGMINFMQPGSRVDLMARVQVESELSVSTIAQNVLVLAVGPRVSATQQEKSLLSGDAAVQQQQQVAMSRSVSLLVTPEQAQQIDLAAANSFRLTLRASNDSEEVKLASATIGDLMSDVKSTSGKRHGRNPVRNASNDPFDNAPKPSGTPAGAVAPVEPTTHKMRVIRNGASEEIEVEVPAKKNSDSSLLNISDLFKGIGE